MIQVNEEGIADLEKTLERLEKAASDLSEVWPKVGQWWRARQLSIFASAGRGTWETLKAPRGSRGILIRTGALRDAVSNPNPISASPTSATFGANGRAGWYGMFHQSGTGGVPMREPILPLDGQDSDAVMEIFAKHFEEAAK